MPAGNPRAGDLWEHANGGEYVVLARATNKDPHGSADRNGLVIYRPWGVDTLYVRRLDSFLARFRLLKDWREVMDDESRWGTDNLPWSAMRDGETEATK